MTIVHNVRMIDSGQCSTLRLFELGMSFGACKRRRRWPSLDTMNTFLSRGTDEGAHGTDVEWDPCALTIEEYQTVVASFMGNEPYVFDTGRRDWDEWLSDVRG